MAYEFHYTPTGTGAISGAEVLEQTEDAINDLGNTAISDVQEALDKAERAFTNSANAVDDAQTALNTANNAEGVAIQAQNDVSNLSGTVTNIGNRVTTAEGNIGNLQGRMTTAEGNITNLQGRMTTAESNIGNLQTAVSTAQATANSAQQTATTARQQSYVFRYSSTALTASSTNSNALLDNTDNLKVGDKVIDSSGALFSITAIDTQNSTFTIGTALIDLAQDSDVVHKSGDETVAGNKNFQGLLTTTPSESLWPTGLNTTDDITYLGREVIHLEYKSSGQLTDLSGGAWDVAALGAGCFFFRINNGKDIRYKNLATGDVNRIPVVSGTNRFINDVTPNQDNTYGLGSSSLRWRTINGLNPGSLGMPDLSNGIDISSYLINIGTSTPSEYTPSVNGWLVLKIASTQGYVSIRVSSANGIDNYVYSERTDTGGLPTDGGYTYEKFASCITPCIKNDKLDIYILPSMTSVVSAYFYPCLGNV